MKFKTLYLESRSSRGWKIAESLGIIPLLTSDGLRLLAEEVTGKRLEQDVSCQVICYSIGDFSGPHNDHHPEESYLRDGYVDVHIMLSEPTVMSQSLVYEKHRGLLNSVEEVGRGAAIAVYQLPFWHYVTPLIPRPRVRRARRWLLLASYIVDRSQHRAIRPA
jgi:hypothetical protein